MRLIGFLALYAWSLGCVVSAIAADGARFDYRVLATTKTSTMEKEMNEAGDAGYAFAAVMGGETSIGGKEIVVVMSRNLALAEPAKRKYKLLATTKTSTMQKEMQQLGDEGFDYKGQTIFESSFGGREVAVIMERDPSNSAGKIQYRLVATTKTSTMQKELREAGEAGFHVVGITVSKTTFGGAEIVSIMKKK